MSKRELAKLVVEKEKKCKKKSTRTDEASRKRGDDQKNMRAESTLTIPITQETPRSTTNMVPPSSAIQAVVAVKSYTKVTC